MGPRLIAPDPLSPVPEPHVPESFDPVALDPALRSAPTVPAIAFSTLSQLPPVPESEADWCREVSSEDVAVPRDWLSRLDTQTVPIWRPISDHLARSKHVIGATVASTIDHGLDDRLDVGETLREWGQTANVIWITDQQRVFDPVGRLLFAAVPEGSNSEGSVSYGPAPDAVLPFPLDARQRKSAIEIQLRNRMIDPPVSLLPVGSVDEIQCVAPAEVARRSIALFLVATRAESTLSGQSLDAGRMRQRCPIGFDALTADERAFFNSPESTADTFAWRYESLMTMQWALDMQFELPWPDEHADLTSVTRLMIDLPDQSIVEQARLRPTSELLDATELHHQLFHAIADAQTTGKEIPGGLDLGVVCERLIALSWICGLGQVTDRVPADKGPADWDSLVHWVENGAV